MKNRKSTAFSRQWKEENIKDKQQLKSLVIELERKVKKFITINDTYIKQMDDYKAEIDFYKSEIHRLEEKIKNLKHQQSL